MSFALRELTHLLSDNTSSLGVVIEREGQRLRIATAQGVVTATSTETLAVGDRVLIQQGSAFKAPIPTTRHAV